jgi:hypothetical protein
MHLGTSVKLAPTSVPGFEPKNLLKWHFIYKNKHFV